MLTKNKEKGDYADSLFLFDVTCGIYRPKATFE